MNGIKRLSKLSFFLLVFILWSCNNSTKDNSAEKKAMSQKQSSRKEKASPPEKKSSLSKEQQREVSAQQAFQADLEKFILSPCQESESVPLDKIDVHLLTHYKQSYELTKLEDGKSFCIHEIYNNSKAVSRIVYTRNEGGHYSDIISLWSLNKKTNGLKQLHLFSEFGKDGFSQKITADIINNTFITTEIEDSRTKKNKITIKKWELLENGDITTDA